MDFSIEKTISNFIENQFPQFYKEEGENFILFTKAYYEWLEQSNNPIGGARKVLDYRDIDNTVEDFLIHFQQKYLYGIPFNVIINKRLLLKHILDVYRSKGTIACYKLLFKMIYNEDVEIYLPGLDILRVSDGTWVEPKFVEVTKFSKIADYTNSPVIGVNSGVRATVENIVSETYNNNAVTVIYFSNITPKGAEFQIGERLVPESKINDSNYISEAPLVLGSIQSLEILDGSRDYKLYDVVKIVQRNSETLEIQSSGKESYLKVIELRESSGEMRFDLVDGGYGFTQDSKIFIYRNDNTGTGASFELGSIGNQIEVSYNTDIVNDYLEKSLEALTYSFPKFESANLNSTIAQSLSYSNAFFGTIKSLENQQQGSGYTKPANVFVRSVMNSKPINAIVTYDNDSPIVSFAPNEQIDDYKDILLNASQYGFPKNPLGKVTSSLESTISISSFYSVLAPDEVICLQANSANVNSIEYQVVKSVVNSTALSLYSNPTYSSTEDAQARVASVIFTSNFSDGETLMESPNEFRNGVNEKIRSFVSSGKNVVSKITALSGKGFANGEIVQAGLYGTINPNIIIENNGTNYSNNDILVFSGPQYVRNASGYVLTDTTGRIVDVVITDVGAGFVAAPVIAIRTTTGSGAILKCKIEDFNYDTLIQGKVIKGGIGKELGYYSTTRGFLNADKYIQDSYYYQDYSYEIKVSRSLNTYKNILYETFHAAGIELFGKFYFVKVQDSSSEILFENNSAVIT